MHRREIEFVLCLASYVLRLMSNVYNHEYNNKTINQRR